MKPLASFDWAALEAALDEQGATVLPALLSPAECRALADPATLAPTLAALRARLLPVAVRWGANPVPAAPGGLVLQRLRTGEMAPLGQDDEAGAFPLRACLLLAAPGDDFEGGELVLVERRPRMQSRPLVVPMRQGDLALFAAHRRPCQGARGVYAVSVKHGVSRVRAGERLGLAISFG